MKVSDAAFYRKYLDGFRSQNAERDRAVEQLLDGKRVRRASDDPSGARVAVELRARLLRIEGFKRTGGLARFELATIESALGHAFDLVTDARTKAVAGFSPGADPSILADQIDEIRDQLLGLANSSRNGRYLFGGTETLSPPFDAGGVYSGNDSEVDVPVESGETVGATVSGRRVFKNGGDAFTVLSDLASAVRNEDTVVVNLLLPAVNRLLDQVNAVRADVGTRLERIDSLAVQLGDESVRIQERVAEIENISPEEALLSLTASNSSYDALAASANRVLGRSLFDYLG